MAGETYSTAIMCISLMVAVITSVYATGIASSEKPAAGIGIIIALPFFAFLYVLGLGLTLQMHAHTPGYIFAVLGVLALLRAMMTKTPSEARSAEVPVPSNAH